MKFFFNSSNTAKALQAKNRFIKKYGQYECKDADIIVPIGGDGFLLKNLHKFNELKVPFFGINYGSIGFLMNEEKNENLENIINSAQELSLKALEMKAEDTNDQIFTSIAYNEVSLMRQTHQAAKINIEINEIQRIEELICDGILVSTPAGSTAYNLSAHGSIIPLDSNLLTLTPISAFRPRRWRGAILNEENKINFKVINFDNRPVSVTADNTEFRNIKNVKIYSSKNNSCKLLFDNNHSIEERILKEQFYS
jgi:NAD+ kinase